MNGSGRLSLRSSLRAASLALCLAAPGCASSGPSTSGDPDAHAVAPRAKESEPPAEPPPGEPFPFASAFRDARDFLDSGEPALAAERLEGALRSNPSAQIRPELLALLREAREAEVAKRWLVVELTAERGAFTIGDTVAFRIRLRNRRDEPIVVPEDAASAGGAVPSGVALSRTRIDLRVAYREIDHLGSVVDSAWETSIWPGGDVRIAPRSAHAIEWSLDTSGPRFRPARLVYRGVTISGTFRPVAFTAPGAATFAPIDFGPLSIDVFPTGYHRFQDDPAARFAFALGSAAADARYLPHVLFGAIFFSRRDPEGCARALSDALPDAGPDLAPTVRGCLELLKRGLLSGPSPPEGRETGSSGGALRPDENGSPRSSA
jgi:hypothetical protein